MVITVDLIVKFGSVLSVLGILWKIYSAIREYVKSEREAKEELKATIQELVEHDKEQHLAILRLTIMNSEMPISERVIAGRKYTKEGGNGDVAAYYRSYLEHLHEDKGEKNND